jgi:Tol biopolymer transport system component
MNAPNRPAARDSRRIPIVSLGLGLLTALTTVASPEAAAATTEVISVDKNGAATNASGLTHYGGTDRNISADGRYVVFVSGSGNLGPRDGNGATDVYLRDRTNRTTERISLGAGGKWANGSSRRPALTPDARYVVFESEASTLVDGDTNKTSDVFVHDRSSGRTERVSVDSEGRSPYGPHSGGSISDDGRYVAFESFANLALCSIGGPFTKIFVRDRQTGTTEIVSASTAGECGNSFSYEPSISADGRYIAFMSAASNLFPGDNNDRHDVFVRDRVTGTTTAVSVDRYGAPGDAASFAAAISADGSTVAFYSDASNLGEPGSPWGDVFVHDLNTGLTELVSVAADGGPSDNNYPWMDPAISGDGRYVAYYANATNLVAGDTNGMMDVFLRDRLLGSTERISVSTRGLQGAGPSGQSVSISADGRYVAFDSWSPDLVPNDSGDGSDVYLRDRLAQAAPSFTLRPASLNFGTHHVATATTLSFWLRNTGTTVLPVSSIALRGVDTGAFSLVHRCGSSLNAGLACRIDVTFTPPAAGSFDAKVRVVAGGTTRNRPVGGTGTSG